MNGITKRTKIHPIDIHVGHRLRERRLQAALGLKAVGGLVGVTAQQIQKYELGQDRLSASRLYLLAVALRVPVLFFYQGLSQRDGNRIPRRKCSAKRRSAPPRPVPES